MPDLCLGLKVAIMDVVGFWGLGITVHPYACLVEMFFELGEGESPRALLEVCEESR